MTGLEPEVECTKCTCADIYRYKSHRKWCHVPEITMSV